VLDVQLSGTVLSATAGGQTTCYLYGWGVIGEQGAA
jgi:hypothetical protein